jgi:hypothetical protein
MLGLQNDRLLTMPNIQERLVEIKTAVMMISQAIGASLSELARLKADHQALIEVLTSDHPEFLRRLDQIRSGEAYRASLETHARALADIAGAVGKLQTIGFDPLS